MEDNFARPQKKEAPLTVTLGPSMWNVKYLSSPSVRLHSGIDQVLGDIIRVMDDKLTTLLDNMRRLSL